MPGNLQIAVSCACCCVRVLRLTPTAKLIWRQDLDLVSSGRLEKPGIGINSLCEFPLHHPYLSLVIRKPAFAKTAQLISAFVFAIWIVQSLLYPYPKFQASNHLLWLYSLVSVGPGRNPEDRFSHNEAHLRQDF